MESRLTVTERELVMSFLTGVTSAGSTEPVSSVVIVPEVAAGVAAAAVEGATSATGVAVGVAVGVANGIANGIAIWGVIIVVTMEDVVAVAVVAVVGNVMTLGVLVKSTGAKVGVKLGVKPGGGVKV